MHLHKVTLVGIGLLGGSLGLALQRRKLASLVTGCVRRPESVDECVQLGVVHEATCDLRRGVEGADLVVLCTPIGAMHETARSLAPLLKAGAVVTDVGSVKEPVVKDLEPLLARHDVHFVGSHPMAGAEKTGPAASKADLFQDAVCVVTPTTKSKPEAVKLVEDLWRAVGAKVLRLAPAKHDDLVSRSSHLPHIVAAELANYVLSPVHAKEQGLLCATGFRDTTRVASGSPEMWRDISLANRKNLARVLGVFIEDLQELQHALENEDRAVIEEFFVNAKKRRDKWTSNGTSLE